MTQIVTGYTKSDLLFNTLFPSSRACTFQRSTFQLTRNYFCGRGSYCSTVGRQSECIIGRFHIIINLPKTYDDAILAQFVVHHATDSNRTIREECLRCHHTCQIFKCRFAVGQLSVNCWYTASQQLTDSIPTDF